jgi:hypothetical protein
VNKRPLGPSTGPYRLVDNPSDSNDTLSDDDQRKKAHSGIEVGIFETKIRVHQGQPRNRPHFNTKKNKPNGPDPSTKPIPAGECKIHLPSE